QYADYSLWQQQWMQGEVLQRHIAHWTEKLKSAPLSLELPLDPPSQTAPQGHSGQETLVLPKATMEAIQTVCRREGMTPFMVILAGLAITLERWTQQPDMVIGTVVAGRNHRELENLIGCFMNFVPLRISVPESATDQEFIRQVKTTVIDAHAHQDCPFEKIVEAINPERKASENPLYNVALLFQDFPPSTIGGKLLKSEPVPVDLQAALLDLRFIADETPSGISICCEYKADLFTPQTIGQLMASFNGVLAALLQEPSKKIGQFELVPQLAAQSKAAREREDRQTIAVAATFTPEPVEDSLKYWMKELDFTARIEFAPYNQVFQQLLDPSSVFGANQRGLNVIFVRLEDWEKTESASPDSQTPALGDEAALERSVHEFISALKAFVGRGATPCLVCICPASKSALLDGRREASYQRMEELLTSSLEPVPGAYVVPSKEITRLYPVAEYHDASAEAFGAIPYTPPFFAALGTIVARKFHALKRPAFKVIVLDCDQTLWSGVCGEDGPDGIQLDAGRRALQEFMCAQSAAGMLLCVCSKNNEADVGAVFDRRRDMPLKKEHFAAWRVNWQSKSENLKELAAELHVGLDTFIFVDDNPVECAEVAANCPQVLTLQLPEPPEQIPQFLNHCWAFDHLKLSAEDRQRNVSYQQERQREQLRAQSLSLTDFLAGLDLQIDITRLSPEQLTRVSQLTLRTNQFNFTTRRRSENDFQAILHSGKQEVLTVSVKDRFGTYGLVGVMVYEPKAGALEVETFLLSCRVLGRGVECQMVRRLGQAALARGLARVDLQFVSSEKNQPAFSFLEKIGSRFRQGTSGGYVYRLPAEYAAGVAPDAGFVEHKRISDKPAKTGATMPAASNAPRRKFGRYGWIARELNEAEKVMAAVDAKFRLHTHDSHNIAPPVTETEKLLCKIWQDLLRRDKVGVRDNFFELGGHSLLAVRLFSEIERATGRKLPLVTLFQSPTIKELADVLSQASGTRSGLVGIHTQGSRPPLFLIHGAGGDVLWGYANLAPYLGDDQPVYGVKSRALDGSEEFGSIEEMAAHYIEQIRSLQPEGPYYLGGYCFGGNVAYEIARQLDAQGEKVELVALLDAAPSNAGYERMPWWNPAYDAKFAVNMYYWLLEFFQLKPEERSDFVKRKTRALGRKVLRKFWPQRNKAGEVDLEEVIDLTKFPAHELRLWQIHLDILVRHVSQPYNGKVTLFRTRGQPVFCSLEEDFGWGRLARDGVDLRIIPGAHESIFIEPNVRMLAQKLNECLNSVKPAAKAVPAELQHT
ncbi:MAG TPA: HAD-IIIC family phosphatase, partial [Verrucomicrobiae bacterium]|nr:HAD-IIIC family phosphatase [Verrucomicrobiae bacterium]